jgi:hypothetical protein
MIRIVSDGTYPGAGTQILNADGKPITGVMRVEILPMDVNDGLGCVVALITVHAALDIVATASIAEQVVDVPAVKESWRQKFAGPDFRKLDLRRRWKEFCKWIAF